MQKLIYQNIRGESVTFYHRPYVLCTLRGLGFPEVKLTAGTGTYQQGESVLSLKREARNVKLTLHVMATSRKEMYRLRTDLAGVLSPSLAFDGENRAKLLYENDFGTWWTWAVPENGLDWGERIQNIQPKVTLNFACESPYWYGAKNEVVFREATGGFRLPFSFPLVLGTSVFQIRAFNAGHAEATPTITFYGSGDRPGLLNLSTGAVLQFASPLPSGDKLTVSTDPSRLSAVVEHPDGSQENGFSLIDPETSLAAFTLGVGENKLRYESEVNSRQTEVRVAWYNCYEGV